MLACALTAASFYVLNTSLIWGPGIPVALVVLAVAQISVHLVFFLHITNAARWRLAIDDRDAFTSTPRAALIVAIDRGVRIAGAKNFWLALEHPLRIRFANFSLLRGGGSEKQISMAPK